MLVQLFKTFLTIGLTAFGGPIAHIAMVEQEIVSKQKLIPKDQFLNYIGMVNLIPGPNSTQLIMLCGLKLKGIVGMLVSGFAFIVPAVLITLILAVVYQKSATISFLIPIFSYLKYGVFPIILFSLIKFTKSASKNYSLAIILIVSAIINFIFNNEILVIFIMGFIGFFTSILYQNHKNKLNAIDIVLLSTIFYKFLTIGFTLFGGGFLLIAYVRDQFSHLLSNEQILDAIAFGQFTPGPILTSVTFMGYQMGGILGALVATLGIFIPSIILIPILDKVFLSQKNPKISLFLDNINASSIGVMCAITIKIAIELGANFYGLPLILINSFLLYKKVPSLYLIILSMIYGYGVSFIKF